METAEFASVMPGSFKRILEGTPAFIPAALPPRLRWDAALARAISSADRALGELAGMGRQVENPHLLIGSFITREAVLSSRIEGTQASLSDVLLYAAEPKAKPRGL